MKKVSDKVYLLIYVLLILVALLLFVFAWDAYQSPRVVVEWSTASELDTIGFNVLRSETSEGPVEQVNTEMVSASDDPLAGGDYSFTDASVQPNQKYYYYLEDIDSQGAATRNGPIEVTASVGGVPEAIVGLALLIVAGLGLSGLRSKPQELTHD